MQVKMTVNKMVIESDRKLGLKMFLCLSGEAHNRHLFTVLRFILKVKLIILPELTENCPHNNMRMLLE